MEIDPSMFTPGMPGVVEVKQVGGYRDLWWHLSIVYFVVGLAAWMAVLHWVRPVRTWAEAFGAKWPEVLR